MKVTVVIDGQEAIELSEDMAVKVLQIIKPEWITVDSNGNSVKPDLYYGSSTDFKWLNQQVKFQ